MYQMDSVNYLQKILPEPISGHYSCILPSNVYRWSATESRGKYIIRWIESSKQAQGAKLYPYSEVMQNSKCNFSEHYLHIYQGRRPVLRIAPIYEPKVRQRSQARLTQAISLTQTLGDFSDTTCQEMMSQFVHSRECWERREQHYVFGPFLRECDWVGNEHNPQST